METRAKKLTKTEQALKGLGVIGLTRTEIKLLQEFDRPPRGRAYVELWCGRCGRNAVRVRRGGTRRFKAARRLVERGLARVVDEQLNLRSQGVDFVGVRSILVIESTNRLERGDLEVKR